MTRTYFTLLFILLLCTGGRAQKETDLASKIISATVFLDGAQVNRTVKTTVPAGRNTLVFTNLTTDLDAKSLQLNCPDEDLIVLSISHRLNFNAPPAENPAAAAIRAKIKALDRPKSRLNTRYKIGQEEEAILQQNRAVASQQNGLNAEDLIKTVNFHRERITAIRMAQLAIADSLEILRNTREDLQKQLAEIGKKRQRKATAEVVVVTESKQATTTEFTLSYLVPNAKWVPHYDVRVADISQPVDLRYRAKVSQNSGEDWTNVRLKLSTGDPTASGVAPTLPVWRLYAGAQPPVYRPQAKKNVAFGYRTVSGVITDDSGEPLIGASILAPGLSTGTVTDIDGRYTIQLPVSVTELTVNYTGFDSKSVPIHSERMNVEMDDSGALLEEVVVTGNARNRRDRPKREKADLRSQSFAPAPSAPVPVQTERRATTVNFDIELPYTIPADGKARDVEIKQHELPAVYTHLAVPKFSPDAYLTAAVTDWEQYDLLSGDIQLFFEGTYLGTSQLDVSSTTDTLKLSLGKDPNIVIERKPMEEFRERNFFGGKITDSRGYRILVRNKKAQTVNLTILDQVPVSANEDVDVKLKLDDAWQLTEKTGMLKWNLQLAPKAEGRITFGYTVKYPKGQRITLE